VCGCGLCGCCCVCVCVFVCVALTSEIYCLGKEECASRLFVCGSVCGWVSVGLGVTLTKQEDASRVFVCGCDCGSCLLMGVGVCWWV